MQVIILQKQLSDLFKHTGSWTKPEYEVGTKLNAILKQTRNKRDISSIEPRIYKRWG